MLRNLVSRGLQITAPLQQFDEMNSGIPEHRRTNFQIAAGFFLLPYYNTGIDFYP